MNLSLDDLKKLDLVDLTARRRVAEDRTLTAVIKVKEPGYVPRGVRLRARVDDKMFTGAFAASELAQLESDQKVVSVSLAKTLRMIG